jgi:thiol-disulfide isomerase/thioredoxin
MNTKKNKESFRTPRKEDDDGHGSLAGTLLDQKFILGILLLGIVLIGTVVFFGEEPGDSVTRPSTAPPGTLTVWYFYGNGCEHCVSVTPYVRSLQKKYPDVEFRILEIYDNPENRDALIAMNQQYHQTRTGIPVAFVGNVVLFGANEIPMGLEKTILLQK